MQATTERTETAAADYLARVRGLLDAVRAAAPETEANRQLPPAIVEQMTAAGVFSVAVPKSWGGPELDPVTHALGIELLAQADASAAWCAMIGCDTGYASAHFEDSVARSLFADPTAATVFVVNPTGAAVPTEGGYNVTGRWTFASGSSHAKVFCLGCIVPTDSGPAMLGPGLPDIRIIGIPREQAQVLDTWTTTGLRGSASHDVAVTNLFVPAERTFSFAADPIHRPGDLYRLRNLFILKIAAIPLGIARGAIDDVLAIAATKRTLGSQKSISEQSWLQTAIAEAEYKYRQSRAFYYEALGELWATLQAGEMPEQRQLVDVHLAMVGAMAACTEVVDSMYRAAGSASLYARHTLDRRFRDIHTAGQHTSFAPDRVADDGKVILGLDVPNSPMISVRP